VHCSYRFQAHSQTPVRCPLRANPGKYFHISDAASLPTGPGNGPSMSRLPGALRLLLRSSRGESASGYNIKLYRRDRALSRGARFFAHLNGQDITICSAVPPATLDPFRRSIYQVYTSHLLMERLQPELEFTLVYIKPNDNLRPDRFMCLYFLKFTALITPMLTLIICSTVILHLNIYFF